MVDSIHLNYISTLGFNKINPNYFLCPEHFLTFKLFKLSYIKGDNKMYNKKQFINNWDLTLVLGEDIAQELKTLQKSSKQYGKTTNQKTSQNMGFID